MTTEERIQLMEAELARIKARVEAIEARYDPDLQKFIERGTATDAEKSE